MIALVIALLLAGAPVDAFDEGVMLFRAGDHGGAATAFEAALAGGGESAGAHFNLASSLEAAGERGRAAAHYRRALALDPGLSEARERLGVLLVEGARARPVRAWLAGRIGSTGLLAGGLLAALAALLLSLKPGARRRRAAPAMAAVAILLAAAGGVAWHEEARPWAVVASPQAALYALPAGHAVLHAELPEGTLVEPLGGGGAWVRVRAGHRTGWVEARHLASVAGAALAGPLP